MKFCHIADLHIGKRLKELSLMEDQRHGLNQILSHIAAFKPDAVFIAGDIYDKAIPSQEAVTLLSEFLTALCDLNCQVLLIGGNHDSPERLAFLSPLLKSRGLNIARPFNGEMEKVSVAGVDCYMLPYFSPREQGFQTFEEAVSAAIAKTQLDHSRPSVLITHFFVTALGQEALRSQSEVDPIGTLNNIDVRFFAPFAYVALGHLHGPQKVGWDHVRYAGSPVKYSFSEVNQRKSMVKGEIKKDGTLAYELIPLEPLHAMLELEGPIEALLAHEKTHGYTHITLTDSPPPPAAYERLSAVFENLLALDFKGFTPESIPLQNASEKDPFTLFTDFFLNTTGQQLSQGAQAHVKNLMESIWKGGR